MPAGSTYSTISTQTISGTPTSVSFTSIPSTYTDLVIVYSAKASTNTDLSIRFNGDTATNYSATRISGTGTAANSGRFTSVDKIYLDAYGYPDTTNYNVAIYSVMNYANTTTYKTIIGRSGNAAGGVDAYVGLWRSTAAISSFSIQTDSGSISTGSTFTLYGIAAA